MPQDAYTLNYLCKELNDLLKNSKINKIVQIDNDKLVLTLYTGVKTERLLIDITPSSPRIGVIKEDMIAPLTAPNFCMLLRKHITGAKVISIELVPFDRIVKIQLEGQSDFFTDTEKTLYVELMGRYSNIILTHNGVVLGGNRGINMFDNGVRPLIVGKPYVFPPSNNKKSPIDAELLSVFENYPQDVSLQDYLFNNVQGISADTAKEIVFRYNQKFSNYSAKDFVELLKEFIFNVKANPCVTVINSEVKDVYVTPFNNSLDNKKYFNTLIEAEEYYFSEKEKLKKFKNLYTRIFGVLSAKLKKAKKRLATILAREKDCVTADQNKIFGELILANIYKIKPRDKWLKTINYYDGEDVEIPLDENLTPSQNAEKYYKKYNKQKRTLIAIEPQKEEAIKEVEYLNGALSELENAESINELTLVLEELIIAGYVKNNASQKRKAEKQTEYLEYVVEGRNIKVGRNNAENDRLTGSSRGEFTWLHVKDYHSSHVVIEGDLALSDKVIKVASEICAYYSKCRNSDKVEVVYTLKKHVKKPPKSPLGFCVYTNFKSIIVKPNKNVEYLKSK